MRKLTIIFWLLFSIFVYKLTFMTKDMTTTPHKFRIYQDDVGISHIYAKTYHDIFFGLGFAQAKDRLWTLYFKRMLLNGRVSQIFGPDGVKLDLEMRNIGFGWMGKNNKEHTDNQTLSYLQSFVNGINEYAKTSKILPLQFYLFWVNWQDWQVEDCLANINLLSFTLEFDWFYEIARQRLLETIGFDAGYKIITYGWSNLFKKTTIMSDEELHLYGKFKKYNTQEQESILKQHWLKQNISLGSVNFPNLDWAIEGAGSNSWVISGNLTQNGKPILASDPHLASLIPSLFYTFEVVLVNDDNEVIDRKFGVCPDGFPTVSVGVSEFAAWGSTASYVDNKDVYYQTVRMFEGKFQYFFKNQWKDFQLRKELIKIRGATDIQETFYHTHRGVVIQSIFMDIHWKYGYPLPQKYKDNHTLSLAPLHYRPDKSSAKGLIGMIFVQTTEQLIKYSDLIQFPNIDSTYILKNGSIGYTGIGAIPKRNIPEMGSFIKDGSTDIYDMGQVLVWDQKPQLRDPPKGYVSMCNNRFASDNFIHRSSMHEITTGRSYRIQKLIQNKIESKQKFTIQQMMEWQLDQRDQFVADILPKVCGKLTELRQIWSTPQAELMFDKLVKWNYFLTKDSIEASIYHVFQYLFQQSLFKSTTLSKEQIDAIVNHGFFENYQFVLLQKISNGTLGDQETKICKNQITVNYPKWHSCQVVLALAFKNLPNQLKKVFNSEDIQSYKWGSIHPQTFKVIPYSDIPLLRNIWGRQFPTGGNSRTLNVAIITHQSGGYQSLGDSVFNIVTDLNKTYYQLDMGITDRILSPFYDNFMDSDKFYEYIPRNLLKQSLPEQWRTAVDHL